MNMLKTKVANTAKYISKFLFMLKVTQVLGYLDILNPGSVLPPNL